jgi:hypothetical protein
MCKPVSSPYLVYRPPNQIMNSNQKTGMMAGLALAAVSALAVMSVISPMQSAFAAPDRNRAGDVEQSANAVQNSRDNLVNAQIAVPANVDVQVTDVNACIIVSDCD